MKRDGIVYAKRSQAGKSEKFRIIRAANTPGIVRAGELIVLVSARGVFVVPDLKNGRLKATKKPATARVFCVDAELADRRFCPQRMASRMEP